MPTIVSNCSNNFGPFQFPEKFIPLAITNLLEGKNVPVYGDGLNVRDWLYVEDHCRAIDLILRNGKIGETYCIGGNSERENIWIVRKLIELLGADDNSIEHVEDRKGHDLRYAIDAGKIESELGWKPEVDLRAGITQLVEWYRTERPATS